MSSLKISQLTATTTNTIGSWVIVNNSGETVSNKSELEYVLGLSIGSATNSMRSNDLLTTSGGTASGIDSIAIGNGATALDDQSIAIGRQSYAARERDIAIGYGANTDLTESQDGIAIGTDAKVVRDYGIAIGYDAIALTDGIAIGRSTRPIGDTCTAIGVGNTAAGNRGYAIGANIFADRDDAGAIGSTLYVDGANSIAVGSNNDIGRTGGQCANSVNIGYNNDIKTGNNQIAIGAGNIIESTGSIVISAAGISGLLNSNNTTVIGTSGLTITSNFGPNNVMVGGLNNTINNPVSKTTIIGGESNNFNTAAGTFENVVALGLSGRSINPSSNTTFVENLAVFGTITQAFQTYSDAGTIDINPGRQGFVQIEATGGTYNLNITPAPNTIGDTISLFIEYTSGATINFVGSGSVQWRFNDGIAPTFSAATVSRSILVFNTWDGNDMWEVSRSMNMV
jgi:hypothetical protein